MDKKEAMRILFKNLPTPLHLNQGENRRLDKALETVEEALGLVAVFSRQEKDYIYVDKAEHLARMLTEQELKPLSLN